jgi:O-antigen ligase
VFNLPSNATLITLYRGGILPFIAFVVLAIMGCVYGYRALRGNSLPRALYGGTFIGLVVVQMQLDHPLADTPGGAITYSIFLAFLVYTDRARREEKKLDALEADAVPPTAPPPTTAAPPTEPVSVSH